MMRRVLMLALAALLTVTGSLFAGNGDRFSQTRIEAANCERIQDWDRAAELHLSILQIRRDDAEARKRLQVCVRRIQQNRRLRDLAYRDYAVGTPLADAMSTYSEIVAKLQQMYFDRSKVGLDRLLQAGIEEILAALENTGFRQDYLAGIESAAIELWKSQLREKLQSKMTNVDDLRQTVRDVALAGQRWIGVSAAFVVLELAAGACNALDDYTVYLHNGLTADDVAGPSVHQAHLIRNADRPDRNVIGYLRISEFQDTTPQELDSSILRLQAAGLKCLVIDLRGNPGGTVLAAIQVAERFISDGVIVMAQGQVKNFNRTIRAAGGPTYGFPLVVIIDGQTASAAEVVAAAVRDHHRATLVGLPTFGKGSVQSIIPLQLGGAIRMTLAKLFDAKGQALSAGVIPHITEPRKDRQLEVALDAAQKLVTVKP